MSENSPAVETADPAEAVEAVETHDVDVVEVRRNGRLALVVALASLLVGIAFVLRGGIEGYLVGLILLVVAAVQGWTAWDSRMPLLLVDEQGVRLRFGQTWQGIPWSKIESVEHTPRPDGIERFWKDGRIGVLLHDEDEVLEELSPTARRQAMLTERLYGLPFSLPLGLSTRVLGAGDDVTEAIAIVAADGVEVVEIDPALDVEEPETDTDESADDHTAEAASDDGDTAVRPPLSERAGDTNPRMLRVLDEPDINAADVVDEAEQDQVDRDTNQDETTPKTDPEPEPEVNLVAEAKAEPVAPLREPSTAVRVDVRYVPEEPQETIAVHGANALQLDLAEAAFADADIDDVDVDEETQVFANESDAEDSEPEGVRPIAVPDEGSRRSPSTVSTTSPPRWCRPRSPRSVPRSPRPAAGWPWTWTVWPSGPGSVRTSSRRSRSTTSAPAAATSTLVATCVRWRASSASRSRRCCAPMTRSTPPARSARAPSSRPSSPTARRSVRSGGCGAGRPGRSWSPR